jgi:hypothetical protein
VSAGFGPDAYAERHMARNLRRIPSLRVSARTIASFETGALAAGATFVSAVWCGVALPGLPLLPGIGPGGDRDVRISLESALLGIEERRDAAGRPLRARGERRPLSVPAGAVRADGRIVVRLSRGAAPPAAPPAARAQPERLLTLGREAAPGPSGAAEAVPPSEPKAAAAHESIPSTPDIAEHHEGGASDEPPGTAPPGAVPDELVETTTIVEADPSGAPADTGDDTVDTAGQSGGAVGDNPATTEQEETDAGSAGQAEGNADGQENGNGEGNADGQEGENGQDNGGDHGHGHGNGNAYGHSDPPGNGEGNGNANGHDEGDGQGNGNAGDNPGHGGH